jgi:hypothetical protein
MKVVLEVNIYAVPPIGKAVSIVHVVAKSISETKLTFIFPTAIGEYPPT